MQKQRLFYKANPTEMPPGVLKSLKGSWVRVTQYNVLRHTFFMPNFLIFTK